MPTNLALPIGMEFFNEFHRDGYYYIDKTEFIQVLLKNRGKVNLFTRPRRFGKTLMMSMLKSFFEIGTDKTLFNGLAITRYPELCEKFMGQYPVISLTLKGVNGNTFEEAFGILNAIILDLFNKHNELVASDKLTPSGRKIYNDIVLGKATTADVLMSIKRLSDLLYAHYGKPVIILVDEYDVPLDKAENGGYYDQMVNAIRTLLGAALKTNENLMFAVLTGCLRISKESIFTGLNNFEVDTVMDTTYNQYFGFTHAEVEKLLADYNLSFAMPQLTEWYDGYNFGGEKMFCPWDVLNQCKQLTRDPDAQPGMFWETTSSNDIIRRFIGMTNNLSGAAETGKTDPGLIDEIEQLIGGGTVTKPLYENLTYRDMPNNAKTTERDLSRNTDNLYNILLMTGYLTAVDGAKKNDKQIALRIPNAEVKDLFAQKIKVWFSESVPASTKREMFAALWSKDIDKLKSIIDYTLFSTISCYDYQENYYHGFMTGLLVNEGYRVYSNKEFGLGREDLMVEDALNRRVILIEVKAGKDESAFDTLLDEAVTQIKNRRYALQFKLDKYSVIEYGMAFIQKSCMLKLAE